MLSATAFTPAAAAEFRVTGGPPASGGALGDCTPSYNLNANAPVAGSTACSGSPTGASQAMSRADFGSIGAYAQAEHYDRFSSTASITAASAGFFDHVTFSSSDPNATFADVSLLIRLDGSLLGAASQSLDGRIVVGDATFIFNIYPEGPPLNLGGLSVVSGFVNPDFGFTDAILRTPLVHVRLNQLSQLELSISARSGVSNGGSGQADFYHSMSVPQVGAVFVLTDGVTANAGDWLVNNRFVGASGAVPEPASWALMIVGFAGMGAALRRRRPTLARTI